MSLPELDFDPVDDDDEGGLADLKLLLCGPSDDCEFVFGDCDVRSSFDDRLVGVPPADDRL
jgi:hypothetical protein